MTLVVCQTGFKKTLFNNGLGASVRSYCSILCQICTTAKYIFPGSF